MLAFFLWEKKGKGVVKEELMPVFYLSLHFLWEQGTTQQRSGEKRSDRGHDGGGEDTDSGRNGLNQYHESTGIWNGAQGRFRSSISAADCVSHPRGKASQGCSTTALNKSIVLHFVWCVCVCMCSGSGREGVMCMLSATSPTTTNRKGQVKCWVRKLCQQEGCSGSSGVNSHCRRGPEADVKMSCFTVWVSLSPGPFIVCFPLYEKKIADINWN